MHKDKFKIRITVDLSYIRKHSWWLACSPIFSIWVSSKKIPKSYIGWPQQPPTEKVPNISKKLDFWWSIPQKGTSIGHFGAGDDQTIWIRKFVEEIGLLRLLRPVRLQRPLRSIWSFGCQGWSNHKVNFKTNCFICHTYMCYDKDEFWNCELKTIPRWIGLKWYLILKSSKSILNALFLIILHQVSCICVFYFGSIKE